MICREDCKKVRPEADSGLFSCHYGNFSVWEQVLSGCCPVDLVDLKIKMKKETEKHEYD